MVNLVLSLLLVAFFWLPLKVSKLDNFLNSPSVNLPKTGEMEPIEEPVFENPVKVENMLDSHWGVINASSDKTWAYLNFTEGKQVAVNDPKSLNWDLAFRRGKVISNGGATNPNGRAGLIDLGEVDFDSVTEAPKTGYIQDNATRTEPENAVLAKWYKYNYLTHKLSAKKNVYALRTANNKYVKMQFLSFYCSNKETGCVQLRYSYQDNGSTSFLKDKTAWVPPETAQNPES